ncbi:OB-fold domain-containing protein [Xenophilus arseniciresistens]|uniref:OB-fold domain-containing protein n=1 Tax=Xenophilus arseniciresistens TaxID=1283306 RepID=A0AAE3ND20_9BURK|nr:OB-fold domain-containing protein [Xenophilus arseniciresistens]MDA7418993.1 OB-fold domain-containing protein [Xenophilus arseniciresistens]
MSRNHSAPRPDVGAPFVEGLRQGRLMLQFDRSNGRAQFYPRPQSLYGEAGVTWREASGRAMLFAMTLSRVAPPHLADALPYVLALVQLDEGPRLLARIDAPPGQLAIGQRLVVDWRHPDSGTFPVFKPAD